MDGVVDVRQLQAHGLSLEAVHEKVDLGAVLQLIGTDPGQVRVLGRGPEQGIARLHQLGMAQPGAVLQPEIEPAEAPEPPHLGHVDHEDARPFHRLQGGVGSRDEGLDLLRRVAAEVPILEPDEAQTDILPLSQETEAGHHHHPLHRRILPDDLVHLLQDLAGPLHGGPWGQLDDGVGIALVLLRQETGRQLGQEVAGQRHQGDEGDHPPRGVADGLGHTTQIGPGHPVVGTVEATQEPVRPMDRPQQARAQGRGEAQGHEGGDAHGDDDGERELAVDDPHAPAHQGHGNEDRRQHQGHGDHRPGDLVHTLAGRLDRRQALLDHEPLHVLHHHDRIVHHQADGQHQTEQAQYVDGKARQVHAGKGPREGHRHHQGRDQGGTQILQEQQDDQKDQDHRLQQGLDHLLNRDAYEPGAVVGADPTHADRKVTHQLVHLDLDRGGHLQCIGLRGELDRKAGDRLGAQMDVAAEGFCAETDACDILQLHMTAVPIGVQDDLTEFLGGRKAAGGTRRGRETLTWECRHGTDGTCRDLDVLGPHRRECLSGAQPETAKFVRVEPDTHGISRAELGRPTHPGQAADGVQNLGTDHVVQGIAVDGWIAGAQCEGHQEIGIGLGHHNTVSHDLQRQARRGETQAILYLDLGDVRIGPRLEGQGNLALPDITGGRVEIEEVVHPGELLLDHGGDGLLHDLGTRPRVGGGDADLGRGDWRVGRYRKIEDGHGTRQGDEDGDDPGEYRPIDEETGHEDDPSILGARGRGRARCWWRNTSPPSGLGLIGGGLLAG